MMGSAYLHPTTGYRQLSSGVERVAGCCDADRLYFLLFILKLLACQKCWTSIKVHWWRHCCLLMLWCRWAYTWLCFWDTWTPCKYVMGKSTIPQEICWVCLYLQYTHQALLAQARRVWCVQIMCRKVSVKRHLPCRRSWALQQCSIKHASSHALKHAWYWLAMLLRNFVTLNIHSCWSSVSFLKNLLSQMWVLWGKQHYRD